MKQIEDYWPNILKDVREFKKIANAENPELRIIWEAVENLMNDQFIETATIRGVVRREKMLEITPYFDDDIESRRFRVLARWNDKLPYTYRILEKKLNQLCGQEHYTMTLNANDYWLDIKIELTRKRMFDEVDRLTRQMVPANIVITVELRYNQHADMYGKRHGDLRPYTHNHLRNEVIN